MLAALVLAALFLSAPMLSAKAVGDDAAAGDGRGVGAIQAATDSSFPPRAPTRTSAPPPGPVETPPPTPPPTPAPTPPPAPPPPVAQPPVAVTSGLCPDATGINVVDPELTGQAQGAVDLLTEYFGCQRFRLDGTGLPLKFGEITPLFNAKVLGYAYSAPGTYEIWLNRDCWGVVESWAEVIAHELGHYLGWHHGDGHPYMWLTPPAGSYATPGDGKLVCY